MVNYRLTETMESRIHRKVYVRFGGEYPETRHRNMKMGVGYLAYIQNTIGNIFSGQVVGETAKNLSERFGKVLQQRKSINMTREDTSTNISTQLDSLIPASKISNLSQGEFVGSVCDNFGEKIEQKIFHCEIVVDNERVAAETKAYKPIPVITDFTGADGKDHMQEEIERNYYQIKEDVTQIIEKELLRIQNDPNLKHLLETADDE
ncbi:hypothetical protein NXX23_28080 [Bacteroides ovatus]|nr:hypothetical protein [Bacteroides ovatus]MCS2763377.1 hypothetical protein [Bacteroides ovatus]